MKGLTMNKPGESSWCFWPFWKEILAIEAGKPYNSYMMLACMAHEGWRTAWASVARDFYTSASRAARRAPPAAASRPGSRRRPPRPSAAAACPGTAPRSAPAARRLPSLPPPAPPIHLRSVHCSKHRWSTQGSSSLTSNLEGQAPVLTPFNLISDCVDNLIIIYGTVSTCGFTRHRYWLFHCGVRADCRR